MRAAIATLLNTPIDDVPDPNLDARIAAGAAPAKLDREAHGRTPGRGSPRAWLAPEAARSPPVDRGAWIGVSPGEGPFGDHCTVMCLDRIVLDPASNWPTPPGMRGRARRDDRRGLHARGPGRLRRRGRSVTR